MRKLLAGAVAVALVAITLGVIAPHVTAQTARPAEPVPVFPFDNGARIGISIRDVTGDDAAAAKLPEPRGVYVESVRADTPAARAGFAAGDVIMTFDGEQVRSARHLTRLVNETPAGRSVKVNIMRGGDQRTLEVAPEAATFALGGEAARNLERRLREIPQRVEPLLDFDLPRGMLQSAGRLGITLIPLSDQLAQFLGASRGVLISEVMPDSPAAAGGLKAGDVIIRVDGRAVSSPGDVSAAVREAKRGASIAVDVIRDKREQKLSVTIPDRQRPRSSTRRELPV